MEKVKAILKKAGYYFFIIFAEVMTLLATGAMRLADQVKRVARKLDE